ncbi:MAG: sugar ABC transporter permease [Firmicutes bacterium]|nr:sugar ABC transporter permease [Bacillota bacterium]
MEKVLRDRKAILIFVGPALLLYVLVLLVPIGWSVVYTFYDGSPITGFRYVGMANFARLFRDQTFLRSFWFTTRYALLVSGGQIVMGLLLALLYHFYLKRASSIVRTLVFFPVVLPTVAVAQMFQKFFEITPQYGLVNAILAVLRLEQLVQPWLGQGSTAFWVLVIMDIWKAMGFYAVLLYAGLIEIPEELIEAARLDGASGWSLVRFMIVPLLTPVLVSSLIFSLNGTLKVFDSVVALTGGGPGTTTTPLTLYMYKAAFTYNEYGYGSAVAVLLTLYSLLFTLLIYRRARQNVA